MPRLGNVHHFEKLGDVFLPTSLDPPPPIYWTNRLVASLDQTLASLGKLESIYLSQESAKHIRWPLLMYESIASCSLETRRIEFDELIRYMESDDKSVKKTAVSLTVNYFHALHTCEKRMHVNLDLIRNLHKSLFNKLQILQNPGEFRRTPIFSRDGFVSAPPSLEMQQGLLGLDEHLKNASESPLIKICLSYLELLLLRPFAEGNSLTSRLLINVLLVNFKYLSFPLLPISAFFQHNYEQLVNRLSRCYFDDEALEDWIHFMLFAIKSSADRATYALQETGMMVEEHEKRLEAAEQAQSLLMYMRSRPILTTQAAAQFLGSSFLTAQRALAVLEDQKFVTEVTGNKRNRRYEYTPYLNFWRSFSAETYQLRHVKEIENYAALWTSEVVHSLTRFREACLEFGLAEVDWALNPDYPVLYGIFSINRWSLRITAGEVKEPLSHSEIRVTIDYSSPDGPYKDPRTFALYVKAGTILWEPLNGKGSPQAMEKIAENSIERFTNEAVPVWSGAQRSTLSSFRDRDQELKGKQAIYELFLAIRNVLGKRTDSEPFWQDKPGGSDLVFFSDDTRYVVNFDLNQILGFLDNSNIDSKVRDRLNETIRALPYPNPRGSI